MLKEKSYMINGKDSAWEHFFLSLESKSLREWKILYLENNSWKAVELPHLKIQDNYQNIIYAGRENNYNIFLKKRFIVKYRDDLFDPAKIKSVSQRNGELDFASANIMYILKRQQGQTIERFRGKRIKELYREVTGQV